MSIHPFLVATAVVVALVLSTGCEKKEAPKVATQVAARVNGDEITVHQLNYFLGRVRSVAPQGSEQARRKILDRLIDEQLVKQKAIASKLDRSPNVILAIEAAKTEILARAYLERIAATLNKPTPEEIRKYYFDHPELFAQRRIFTLEEFLCEGNDGVVTELQKLLSKPHSMKEIANWLQSRGVKFTATRGVRAAEQISLGALPKLQAMKESEIQLFDAGEGHFQVIRVAAFKAAPLDEVTARPRIQQFLFNLRSREAIADEMKRIREVANIEYVGEFASTSAATTPEVKRQADVEAKPESPAKREEFKYSWERQARPKSDRSSKER